jgi:cell division protein FtsQ
MSQTTSQTLALPIDVRLMNISAVILAVGVLVAAAIGVARWAVRHPVFAIAKITVQGDTVHNNAVTLRANVASRLQGGFFTLDLAQARTAFEAVPWVRKAVVQREFPNQLRVQLQEHRSAGLWGSDGESRLVNTYGEVFEANAGDAESEDMPRLIGPEGHGLAVLDAYRALNVLFTPLDANIEELELTGRGGWRMQLDGGAVIEMGHGTQPEILARVKRFIETYTQVLSAYQRTGLERIESVDLRHNEGYAIRLRGVTTLLVAPGIEKK